MERVGTEAETSKAVVVVARPTATAVAAATLVALGLVMAPDTMVEQMLQTHREPRAVAGPMQRALTRLVVQVKWEPRAARASPTLPAALR